eukprot:TRINITY_DN284_c0_g1_i1.p1 TRINITY_DN284_c0_g1~~TRINITY_DN284_c0_g1_i1.p1  ORF type:complete len:151 (-),score=42.72 TRINITY_DN284_c0_g1_i1:71-523(-)
MSWIRASHGAIPENALVAGYEKNGEPLYISRSSHEHGIHPGKVSRNLGAAHFPYATKEVMSNEYEVFVVDARQMCSIHWKRCEEGNIPDSAVHAGSEKSGETLFVARTKLDGGVHLGKAGYHLKDSMSVSYGGKEHTSKVFEILVMEDHL